MTGGGSGGTTKPRPSPVCVGGVQGIVPGIVVVLGGWKVEVCGSEADGEYELLDDPDDDPLDEYDDASLVVKLLLLSASRACASSSSVAANGVPASMPE